MSDTDQTKVDELPPDEQGPVPVTISRAEPRWFGLTPAGSMLAVGVAASALGVVMLAAGSTIAGVILLAFGVFVLAALWWRPLAGVVSGPLDLARTTISAQSDARRRVARLRSELDEVERERRERARELGEAVYRGERAATTKSLRAELEELERRAAEKQEEIDRTVQEASERIGQARLQTGRTQVVALEPYPPPDEADVPEHPDIPEPYPPPDEGDRPEQPNLPGDDRNSQ